MTGKELSGLRIQKGVTRSQAARMVEVNYREVYGWEESEKIITKKAFDLYKMLEAMPDKKEIRPIITHPPKGNEIKILREAYGLSISALADMVGVSDSAIVNYEKGRRSAPPDIEDSFCEIFGIKARKDTGSIRTGSGATWRE